MKILTALGQYLFGFQIAMSPLAEHVTEDVPTVEARYQDVAADIAEVVMDPAEPPLFSGPQGRQKTGVLMDSLALYEARWNDFVDDGRCNQKGYKADRRGDCDQGKAWSIFQVQPAGGLVLRGTEWAWWNIKTIEPRIVGPDLIADRKVAIRVSLHMARQSLRAVGSLAVYTHEPFRGPHPNADARMKTALDYVRKHPIPEEQLSVLVEPDWQHLTQGETRDVGE